MLDVLASGRLPGARLVVFWAGHELQAQGGPLRLMTQERSPDAAPTRTAEFLTGMAARTAASQVLLLFGTWRFATVVVRGDRAHCPTGRVLTRPN